MRNSAIATTPNRGMPHYNWMMLKGARRWLERRQAELARKRREGQIEIRENPDCAWRIEAWIRAAELQVEEAERDVRRWTPEGWEPDRSEPADD